MLRITPYPGRPASNLFCPQAGSAVVVLGWAEVWKFRLMNLWKCYRSAAPFCDLLAPHHHLEMVIGMHFLSSFFHLGKNGKAWGIGSRAAGGAKNPGVDTCLVEVCFSQLVCLFASHGTAVSSPPAACKARSWRWAQMHACPTLPAGTLCT